MFRWIRHAPLILLLAGSCVFAQYPARAIHFIVPFPAGGSTDLAARVIAQSMSQSMGQPVIVDNRPGADGIIAGTAVAKAAPEGYTFLVGTASALCFAPIMRKATPYDPVLDFTPISRLGDFAVFAYVNADFPARSIGELVSLAKASPGSINYGASSATGQLFTVQFAQLSNIQMTHVPYKGDAPMIQDLVAGRVQLTFAAGAALPFVKDGKLRVLATSLPSRSPLVPDAPTLEQAGIHGITITPWVGLFGPPGLPRDVVERVSHEVNAALARPEVRDALSRLGFEGRGSTPEELAALMAQQLPAWKKAMQTAGMQPE